MTIYKLVKCYKNSKIIKTLSVCELLKLYQLSYMYAIFQHQNPYVHHPQLKIGLRQKHKI